MGIAIENDLFVAQNQEAAGHFAMLAFRQSHHLVGGLIELMSGHGEGILQAMGHQERTGLVDVALFHDQINNRVRCHRIKSASRRIVENDLGLMSCGRWQ